MRGGAWTGNTELTEAQLNLLRLKLKKKSCKGLPVAGLPDIRQHPKDHNDSLQFYEAITNDAGNIEKYLIPDPPNGWDTVLDSNGDLKMAGWSYIYSSNCN